MKQSALGLLALVLLVIGASDLGAQESKSFSAESPTRYTDGTPLDPVALDRLEVRCGPETGDYSSTTIVFDGVTGTVTTAPALFEPGDHYCAAFAITTSGVESEMSGELFFSAAALTPEAPTALTLVGD